MTVSTVSALTHPGMDDVAWTRVGTSQYGIEKYKTTAPFTGTLKDKDGSIFAVEGTTAFTLERRAVLGCAPDICGIESTLRTESQMRRQAPAPEKGVSVKQQLLNDMQTSNTRLSTPDPSITKTGPKPNTYKIVLRALSDGSVNCFSSSSYQNYGQSARLEREGMNGELTLFADLGPYLPVP